MSKRNRERRAGEGAEETTGGGGGGIKWLAEGMAVVVFVVGFMAWSSQNTKLEDTKRRLADMDQKFQALQTQVANAAKAKPPSQGPDPNKVYTVKTDGSPTHGNPTAPIVIAEFSDYQ
jgi:protein-disulfide isomerase